MAAPVATTGADSLKAAARRRNVQRAEQRILQGRSYTGRTLNTLRRAGVDPTPLLSDTPHPFKATLHERVREQHQATQMQALRHALKLIAQQKQAANTGKRPAPGQMPYPGLRY